MRAVLALPLVALALAGCVALQAFEAQEPAPSVQADGPQSASSMESVLLYFQHIKQIPAADLGREHDAARRAYAQERSDINRVRLAMVLSLPNTAVRDRNQALELLEPPMKDPRAPLHGIATLIGTYLQEQRRLDGSMQDLQRKLDQLTSVYAQEQRRHEGNMQELQRRHESNVQEMQKKLDQLKSLERSLIEREREGAPRR